MVTLCPSYSTVHNLVDSSFRMPDPLKCKILAPSWRLVGSPATVNIKNEVEIQGMVGFVPGVRGSKPAAMSQILCNMLLLWKYLPVKIQNYQCATGSFKNELPGCWHGSKLPQTVLYFILCWHQCLVEATVLLLSRLRRRKMSGRQSRGPGE